MLIYLAEAHSELSQVVQRVYIGKRATALEIGDPTLEAPIPFVSPFAYGLLLRTTLLPSSRIHFSIEFWLQWSPGVRMQR